MLYVGSFIPSWNLGERAVLENEARVCGEYLANCSRYLEAQTERMHVMLPTVTLQ